MQTLFTTNTITNKEQMISSNVHAVRKFSMWPIVDVANMLRFFEESRISLQKLHHHIQVISTDNCYIEVINEQEKIVLRISSQ